MEDIKGMIFTPSTSHIKLSVLLSIVFLINNISFAQQAKSNIPKANWYNLNPTSGGMLGISMDKAYDELLKGKTARPIIVAVIDGGLDFQHDDLKNMLWTNPKEIPNNRIDDDHNGYIDDIHGWNFLGNLTESYELGNELIVLEIREYRKKFGNKDSTQVARKNLQDYRKFLSKQMELDTKLKKLNQDIDNASSLLADLNIIQKKIGKENLNLDDLKTYKPVDATEANVTQFMISVLLNNPDFKNYIVRTKEAYERNQQLAKYKLNINYNPRANHVDRRDRFYGNGNIYGSVPPAHGTHVAGIIAAERNNDLGINGVADHVQLMTIRAIPDGHAPGEDQANAIRYAADNGAKVINMSFGLGLQTDAQMIRDAINYALEKDILFVCAAGNDSANIDLNTAFPDRKSKADQSFADVFLKVGASGFTEEAGLMVPFSNYGLENVDIFAPGLGITSTIPGNKYEAHSGTSMAAPVVTGLAAVIREYYPQLNAKQVKRIIMESVVKKDGLKNLCASGGIANAYNALKIAATY